MKDGKLHGRNILEISVFLKDTLDDVIAIRNYKNDQIIGPQFTCRIENYTVFQAKPHKIKFSARNDLVHKNGCSLNIWSQETKYSKKTLAE